MELLKCRKTNVENERELTESEISRKTGTNTETEIESLTSTK
jgi:hypothetical protein